MSACGIFQNKLRELKDSKIELSLVSTGRNNSSAAKLYQIVFR
jgi:hypothetical protein